MAKKSKSLQRILRDMAKANIRKAGQWTRAIALRLPFIRPHVMIYAGVATMPQRRAALEQAIASLRPQVDRIFVFLNDYESVPEFLTADPKIEVFRSQDHGNLGAAGKFFGLTRVKSGTYFCFDDDLIYPRNYVMKMRSVIRACKYKAVVGVHGAFYPTRPRAYFDRALWHYRLPTSVRSPVSMLGTGTVAFPVSLVPISLDTFKSTDRADLWFGVYLKEKSIPAVVVERWTGWLVDIDHRTLSLYDKAFVDSRAHSEVVFDANPWGLSDIFRRSAGLESAMSPAWRTFVDLYGQLQKDGAAAAAKRLGDPGPNAIRGAGERLSDLIALIQRYCDEAEKFSLFAALAERGDIGASFEGLADSGIAYHPGKAIGLLKRAWKRALKGQDEVRAATFARRILAHLRQQGQLDEANDLVATHMAAFPGSRMLIRERLHLAVACKDGAAVLEMLRETYPRLSESEWFHPWLAMAVLQLYGIDYALPSIARISTRGGKMTAMALHFQSYDGPPPRIFPTPELLLLEQDCVRDARDCEPVLKLYVGLKQREAAASLFSRSEPALRRSLDPTVIGTLRAACQASPAAALEALNDTFAGDGMRRLQVRACSGGSVFERLGAGEPDSETKEGPLVTVVVTTGNADARTIEWTVRSVTDQSHRNLQILLVARARASATRDTLDRIAALDTRTAIVESAEDRDDYAARNAGIAAASGEYVTFQRAGDFAHPQRIEVQLAVFGDARTLACYARAATLDDEGLVTMDGNAAVIRDDTESLMCRARVFAELGGFCRTKWRGDVEFRDRILVYFGDHSMQPMKQLLQLSAAAAPAQTRRANGEAREFASKYLRKHLRADGQREALMEPL